jgi:hypothetical protein
MVADPERLIKRRRTDSQAKAAQVRAVLAAMVETGQPLALAELARQAGVSRRFIYDHPELRAEITSSLMETSDRLTSHVSNSARVNTASLRADLENAKARNRRLESELATLKRRLGQLIGAEAVADIGEHDRTTNAQLHARIEQLDQELFDAREELAQRGEELDAARQINRELLGRLNRSTR